jgi:hypothetical protein
MPTATEALEKMREICLALPDTREGPHFGDVMFYVGKKPFASCGTKQGACEIIFQLEPAHAEGLLATDARFTRYPRDKRGIVLKADDVKSWSEVKALITESYDIVTKAKPAPKNAATKKQVATKKKAATKKAATKKAATKKAATKKKAAKRKGGA